MEDLDVNISIWRICMTATLQAAVHLGIDYAENLHSAKNQPKRTVQQLFNVTSRLVKDQKSKVYLEKDNFSYWQGSSVIRCEYLSVLRLSIVYGRDQWKSRQSMEGEDWLVSELTSKKRIGSNRWRADGVRVDKFPRVHYIADPRRDSKVDDWIKVWTWANPRTDYPHVNVQRHCMERRRKQWIVYCEFLPCCRIYKKKRARSLVVSWASSEKQWYGGHVYKPNGEWDKVADIMMMNLQ